MGFTNCPYIGHLDNHYQILIRDLLFRIYEVALFVSLFDPFKYIRLITNSIPREEERTLRHTYPYISFKSDSIAEDMMCNHVTYADLRA